MIATVIDIVDQAIDVRSVTFGHADGSTMASFVPGSHILVRCGADRYNAYSLTGVCLAPPHYSISVRRDGDGSSWLHQVEVGEEVEISTARSVFGPIASARWHLLIAGGIGVTGILSHARAAGSAAEALYIHRPGRGAHADELRGLCGAALVVTDRGEFTEALRVALRRQPLGTHLYVCGPASLIDDVEREATAAGWPPSRVHHERFTAIHAPARPFDISMAGQSRTVHVPADVSALDALAAAGVAVPHLCRHGVCGQCRTRVVGGRIEHRDLFLSDDEKAAGDAIMLCVSRAVDDEIEVEL